MTKQMWDGPVDWMRVILEQGWLLNSRIVAPPGRRVTIRFGAVAESWGIYIEEGKIVTFNQMGPEPLESLHFDSDLELLVAVMNSYANTTAYVPLTQIRNITVE